MGLVQAVVQAARHELAVAARESEHQQRAVGGVEDGVLERHVRRQGGARRAVAHRVLRHDRQRLQPAGASMRRRRRRRTRRCRPAAPRRRCRDGPRSRSRARARRRRAGQMIAPRSAPRRWPPRSSPAPRSAGSPSASRNGSRRRGHALEGPAARFERSRGTGRSVSKANSPGSSTSSSRCRSSAAAKQSKPGPRFAEEAGTRTDRAYGSPRTARSIARRSTRAGTTDADAARSPSAGP